jgi:hypothetical protein
MAMNHHIITARDMMEDEAISPFAILDYLVPYNWLLSLGRTAIGMCDCFGHGFIAKIVGMFLKVIMFFVIMAFLWIPINVFFRGACFLMASIIRLCKGVGGKNGLIVNVWFLLGYVAIFAFVYMPFVIPTFMDSVSWDQVLTYMNII